MNIQLPNNGAFARFSKWHVGVLKALDEMSDAYIVLLSAVQKPENSKETETIFFLAGAIQTEFEEVVTLATNGYGSGATKLLRSLYERTVTAQYLMKKPEKIQQFLNFTHIHWHKLLQEADENGVGEQLNRERREEIEANFKTVERDFTEVVCKSCNKTRLQMSWTKKPVPSQASEIETELRLLCFPAYLMPTFFLHTTDWGIKQQIVNHADGKKELHNAGFEWMYADKAIALASTLMAYFLFNFNVFFKLGLDGECEKVRQAVHQISRELLDTDAARESAPKLL